MKTKRIKSAQKDRKIMVTLNVIPKHKMQTHNSESRNYNLIKKDV